MSSDSISPYNHVCEASGRAPSPPCRWLLPFALLLLTVTGEGAVMCPPNTAPYDTTARTRTNIVSKPSTRLIARPAACTPNTMVHIAKQAYVTTTADTTICHDDELRLTARTQSPAVLIWYNERGEELLQSNGPTRALHLRVRPMTETLYYVVLIETDTIRDTAYAVVHVDLPPALRARTDTIPGNQDTLTLEATVEEPSVMVWYDQNDIVMVSSGDTRVTSLRFNVVACDTRLYTVEARTPFGCAARETVRVVDRDLVVTSTRDTVCTGDEVILVAEGIDVDTATIWSAEGRVVGQGNRLAIRPTTTTTYTVAATHGPCQWRNQRTIVVRPALPIDVRIGSGSGSPGTTVTTALTVMAEDAVDGPLIVNFGMTLPMAQILSVEGGVRTDDGHGVIVPGPGTYQITWDLLLSGQVRTPLSPTVSSAACIAATTTEGELQILGCTIKRRAITTGPAITPIVTTAGRRLRVDLRAPHADTTADADDALPYTVALWTLAGEQIWSHPMVVGDYVTTGTLTPGMYILRVSLPWGTVRDMLTVIP